MHIIYAQEIILNSSIKNNPILLILVILIVMMAVGWIIPSIMGDRIGDHEGGTWSGPWHMMGIGGMWMFPFFPIIILVVILYLVFGRNHGCLSGPNSGDSALEILKKRYAKGEIRKNEFEEMKKELLS